MNDNYPDWFLWAYQKGFVFWLSIAAVFGFSLWEGRYRIPARRA